MSKLIRNDSPGALTRQQAFEIEKKRMAQRRQAAALAAQGRGQDTEIAHVACGELVIPHALQSPDLLNALRRAAAAQGVPFERLRVGSPANSINPHTGAPEFGVMGQEWISNLFKPDRAPDPNAAKLPPDMAIPPGMSMRENIKEAEERWNPFWFKDQVNTGGPWDYKKQGPKYEDFGNFHYGATGAAMGWPDSILKRLAGQNHMNGPSARPEFGHWLRGAPYGDDPTDQDMIQKGIDYYYNRGR